MSVGAVHDRRRSRSRPRAPAIPARTATKSRCRPAEAEAFARRLLARSRGRADRPRRARHAAARGRPLPLWPRTRRDDRSDRGGARLVDPEAPPRGRRFSGRGAHSGGARRRARRAGASACGSRAGRPARDGAEIVDEAGARIGVVTSGGFGPSVGGADRDGLCRAPRSPRPERRVGLVVRGKPLAGATSPRLPFHPHAYHRG